MKDARHDVAAELVRTPGIFGNGERRGQRRSGKAQRITGGNDIGERRHQYDDDEEDKAEHGGAVAAKAAPQNEAARRGRRGENGVGNAHLSSILGSSQA